MERLAQKDFRLLLDAILFLNDVRTPDKFAEAFLRAFPALVSVDAASCAHQEPGKLPTVEWTIGEAQATPLLPALQTYMHEHSFFPYIMKTGDLKARHLHDDLSLAVWKRRALYNEFYRPVGLETMTGFGFSLNPLRVAGGFRGKRARPFSERDRLVINLLRPHAIQAYENAEAWSQAQQTLTAQSETLEFLRRGLIQCDDSGFIHSATPLAYEWLNRYFHLPTSIARRLPEALFCWIKKHNPLASSLSDAPSLNSPYVTTQADKRLTIRCLRTSANLLLLLEERYAGVSVEALGSLGLTNRQTEILAWIAQGKTNPDIGQILGVSPRTVQKHVEHLYQKLGIETRAAAVAIVMQCCQQTDIGS